LIIDTTYLLPLARIAIDADLLEAIANKAVEVITSSFRIIPFHRSDIIELSYQLKTIIPDYLDCVIIATAVAEKEDLVTEDSLILAQADRLEKEYGIRVMSYREIVRQ